MTDPYASREGATWEAVPRQDPVVWGRSPGPLTPDQLAAYDRDGFVRLGRRAGAPDLLAEAHRLAEAGGDAVIREPDSDRVRSVFRVHDTSPAFAALCADLAACARQVLGGPVYVHQSRVNFKPALRGREFFWHSDFETWHVEDGMPRMRALSAVVHLTASHPAAGPLMLVPGSHRTYVRCVGRTPERHYDRSLRRQEYGVPDPEALAHLADRGGIEVIAADTGDVVLFDCNTLHGSTGNLSPWPRTSLFVVFNHVDNALTAPYSGQPPRPGHIAARTVVPVG